MNIMLFGGAFNPPHIGHRMIATQVLDFTECDEVWLIPNFGQLPPKPNMASPLDRLQMVKTLVSEKIKVNTLEIDNKLNGHTIDLLPFLPDGNKYSFLIGSDQLPVFHTWGRWEELILKMSFFVFPRFGYKTEPLYNNMQMVKNENLIVTDISSTKIRNRVSSGLSISEFVPEGVLEYIKDHNLYQKI